MKAIQEAAGQDLQWRRPTWWKGAFECRSGDEVLTKLSSEKHTGRIIAETADGHWAFKQHSWWNANSIITEVASQAEIEMVGERGRRTVEFHEVVVSSKSHTKMSPPSLVSTSSCGYTEQRREL